MSEPEIRTETVKPEKAPNAFIKLFIAGEQRAVIPLREAKAVADAVEAESWDDHQRPCDDCGAVPGSLVKAAGSSLFLCADCRERIAESVEVPDDE